MSLLSKRNVVRDKISEGQGQGRKPKPKRNPGSLSQRKPAKRRPFQIAETELEIEHPFLGGGGGGGSSGSFLSSLDPDSLFASVGTSSSTSSSSSIKRSKNSNLSAAPPPTRNRAIDAVLDSSKLSTITSDGPIEANPRIGKRKLKAAKNHVKSLTKGSAWFNMAKTEVTKEKKNDLDVLKLRSAMEGIHHYKRNNMTHTPKYFQVGTIVETKADFYSARIPKRQRKKTLAQEFAAEFDSHR